MRCVLLKLVDELLRGRAQYVVDLVDLVKLVFTREEWKERENFEEDATYAPDVHFVAVVAVGHETFRRSVPARADVLSERWLVEKASAAAQVRQLDGVLAEEDILSVGPRWQVSGQRHTGLTA